MDGKEVLALDAAAQRAGLRVGMPATKAQPWCRASSSETPILRPTREPSTGSLSGPCGYAPIVAADPPDGQIIDTTGAAHLHGGEDAMLKGMIARLAASGIAARAAIADSWGAAHAFARTIARPALVVPPGESAKAVLDLPVAALRLPKDMLEELRVLGFECIGASDACLALRSRTWPPPRSGHGTPQRAD